MIKKVLIGAGALAVIGLIVAVSLTRTGGGRGAKVYMEDARTWPSLKATVSASGQVRPRVEVNISSQVMGQIVSLPVAEGQIVRSGQVLVQLDPERYRSEVMRLEASLRVARVNVERERVTLKTAEITLRRIEALHRERVASDDDLDQARLSVDSSRVALQSLQEQIGQVEADLARARDDLSKTTLKAPIDALVSLVNAKVGEQVIIGTMNNPGTVILTLSDMGEILAEVDVDETEVTQVHAGQTAEVRVDAVASHAYDGIVESIGNTAEREGTVSRFPVKVLLRKPDDLLRPGMSAHASIQVDERRDVLAIPLQALVRRSLKDFLTDEKGKLPSSGVEAAASGPEPGGGAGSAATDSNAAASTGGEDLEREQVQVVLVERAGRASMVKVKTGISDAFRVEILEGIAAGDRVILGPYRRLRALKNGDYVRRVEKSELGDEDET